MPSRYAGQPTIAVPTPDGGTAVLSAPRIAPPPDGVTGSYTVREGDRLDLLARAVVGDSTGWWRIADANAADDATDLEAPGRRVTLPGG
ncbi:MAG TPA: LysM domain-containing protein [Micromonosporaceae bacterium]|nr:LysM domain-containing protein [Micromonosporaceae bacterium]